MYYHNLNKLNESGVSDWCMKYHVTSGMTVLGTDPTADGKYNVKLTGSDIFFKGVGVTDLHFSFRIDTIDTILSYMIADRSNTWVMTDGKVGTHVRKVYPTDYLKRVFDIYSKNYQAYNEYVKRYSQEYNCTFYPYETIHNIIDVDNDPTGMVKQLTKEQKVDLVINYDEVISTAYEFAWYHGKINTKTGVLET